MSRRYYSVISGSHSKVYTDWNQVENLLKNYPGTIFKTFWNQKDADNFLHQNKPKSTTNKPLPEIKKTNVYTYGYYNRMKTKMGFGIIIITSNGEKITAHGIIPNDISSIEHGAELYAIYVGLSLVKGEFNLYNNYPSFTDKPDNELLRAVHKLLSERKVTFYNYGKNIIKDGIKDEIEEVIKLSEKGCCGTENLIIHKNEEKV